MLSLSLPLFPLPTVVLFPNVFLPLHIFEPRYRQMVSDVLAGDRIIGMVTLRPGHENDYEGTPPVYPTGCSGLITHVEMLADGRYNLVLRGIEKFTIQEEEGPVDGRLYRTAAITPIDETVPAADRAELRAQRKRLLSQLSPIFHGAVEGRLPETMPDEDLVNALAQYLEFDPMEKLALLERHGSLARCRSMVELLEMKAMMKGSGIGEQGSVH